MNTFDKEWPQIQDNLRQEQLRKLRHLIHNQSSNHFYQSTVRRLSNLTHPTTLEDYIAHIPFTEKHQLIDDQKTNPPYGTNLSLPLHQYKYFHQTTGTTATPLRWLDTIHSWQAIIKCWQQIYLAAGVTAADRICFTFSFGPFLGFWSAYEAANQMGCFAIPAGGMNSQARIRLILDTQATVLCCTPSYALHLAQVAREANLPIKTSNIQRIIVAGEPGGSIQSTRSVIEESWNAMVKDHHGMTETGPLTYPCPTIKDTLHVLENSYFAEIIDPESQQEVANHQEGELVITTLDRCGSPLLRYRTGDLVKAGQTPCPCGSPHLSLEGGIRGRLDDMIIIRGVNIHPSSIEDLVRRFAAAAEYRVIIDQRSVLQEISIQIELETEQADNILLKLRQEFATLMNLRINFESVPVGTLPRQEMKAKRWTSIQHSPKQ